MSTTAPFSERTATLVLLALWKQPESTLQQLLRETLAPLPDVQQALALLRERRCQIEQTPTSVRLAATGLACWQDVLQDIAKRKRLRIGRRVMVFHRTASTNDVAWQAATGGNPENDGLLVLADEQSAGRGRLGHAWSAKAEQSILMSLLLRTPAADSLDRLTLLAGLAAAKAIEKAVAATLHQQVRVQIKWPNDLLIDDRKLAGVLVERRGEQVVVGIGINVAQASGDFPPDVAPRAISIYQATGKLMDRLRIVAPLVEQLDVLEGGGGGRVDRRVEIALRDARQPRAGADERRPGDRRRAGCRSAQGACHSRRSRHDAIPVCTNDDARRLSRCSPDNYRGGGSGNASFRPVFPVFMRRREISKA
jgi:biotin-[acetyl-CoA-carboxylase] ligase BirA-like protein